jgi:hypothetical protein
LSEFVAEQGPEWLGEFVDDGVVVIDEKPLEERLVELAPQLVGRSYVGALAVLDEIERSVEIGLS